MLAKRENVYKTYWYLAAERQNIFFNKLRGQVEVTTDPILQHYKFCNAYRASDRVSQFLIRDVIYSQEFSSQDLLLRIVLFRLFNSIDTWKYLEQSLGVITLDNFDSSNFSRLLNARLVRGERIYGNAFILCATKAFGFDRKHDNHLALVSSLFTTGKSKQLLAADSLTELVAILKTLPLVGNFMAYQIATDLNYSSIFDFSENSFTLAGPGAVRGIKKAFTDLGGLTAEQIIMQMVENQETEFARYGIKFQDLFGRPLQAIDCQNLFCELDKYSRAKFPELTSNRSQIKSTYHQSASSIAYFYPPKWGINSQVDQFAQAVQHDQGS